MAFSEAQTKKLSAKLSDKHIRTRTRDGTTLSYIEGWHAIAEANRIFGFDGWNRETLDLRCVWEGKQSSKASCCYMAHVRVSVQAGEVDVIREGTGFGSAQSISPTDTHELAVKAAETDAMKRALATFGNPFGLALYDKKQAGVRRTKAKNAQEWIVFDETGKAVSIKNTPVQFCSEVRKTLENISEYPALMAFWNQNQNSVAELRQLHPRLKTDKGLHYGEVLSDLYTRRLAAFAAQQNLKGTDHANSQNSAIPEIEESADNPSNVGEHTSPSTSKNTLCKGPNRARDASHLKFVASQACLICGRTPSQAHHLKHAQLRAMGRKPGDQWAVPLCAIHHRKLHDHGNEAIWWPSNKIDPIKVAVGLWAQNH